MIQRIFHVALLACATATSVVPSVAQQEGTLRWSFATQGLVLSSPAVAADGTIYVGSESKRLWAINADGSFKWRWPATLFSNVDWFDSAPAVAPDGTIYAGNFDGKLYALNPDGTLKWSYDTSAYIISSPAIGEDGTVYVGSGDGSLHAIAPDGTARWQYVTGDWVDSSPAIAPDGSIVFGSWDGNLYSVFPDGTAKWSVDLGEAVQSSPAIGPDGTIYVGSGDGRLYAVSAIGQVHWTFQTGDVVDGHPIVGPDGRIYFGSASGLFHALNADGTPAWPTPYDAGQGIFGGAVLRADGAIVFGASDRRIHALNADGALLWTYTTGDLVDSSPTIAADGTIYVGSYDNKLYALHGNGAPLAESAWPKFRRDSRNVGRAPAAEPLQPPGIVAGPDSLTVDAGAAAMFSVVASGSQPIAFQWLRDGAEIDGAVAGSYSIEHAQPTDAGVYSVRVTNAAGAITSAGAALVVNPPVAPTITLDPRALTVVQGGRAGLWVQATGSEPLAYQWSKNGVPVAGAVGAAHDIGAVTTDDAGTWTVTVSNSAGATTSLPANLVVVADGTSRLVNISTRAQVGTGASILIPGFVVGGTSAKRLLVRASGPTLATFEVSGTLDDPRLAIFSGGTLLFANDDWHLADNATAIAAAVTTVGAFEFLPGSADAGALVELAPGGYTVQVSGSDGGTGVALVEVYEVDAPSSAPDRLLNISTRADVGLGDAVMIPGFVVGGTVARTFLIRAVGPSLSGYGVENFLSDPRLQLFAGTKAILSNDDWTDAPDAEALSDATTAVGAFELEADSADAAMLVVLMPGDYTAQATGADGGTGNVLVEVYEVP
ncbi:hypothetical protein ASA1KI_41830 [Opitutales bacterium ASA1]|uniref:outer membrane protein assembly factor BamB family protein n=1 Tax=Congregicoccus parvus TaxID=3081749 RepID=UPI002B318329|nr:hypothetical protein ASA1KI_41830 [Opitutales bacterium ASA1]